MAVNRATRSRRGRRAGLSLVEAMIAMVIVAVMLVMALNTLGTLARARQVQSIQCRTPALAQWLLAEILQSCYQEPYVSPIFGPEAPETTLVRANYDDVDDYNGWSASPHQMTEGTVMANLTGWSRSVTVQYVDPDSIGTPTGTDQGIKRITVTVTDPRGVQTILYALRASNSVYDLRGDTEITYLTWVGAQLQSGSDQQGRVVSGANILNQIPVEE